MDYVGGGEHNYIANKIKQRKASKEGNVMTLTSSYYLVSGSWGN